MTAVLIWDPFYHILGGITFFINISVGLFYIIRGRQRENSKEKALLYGYACSVFGCAIVSRSSLLAYYRGGSCLLLVTLR